ncbi:hypothetical protein CW710_01255 [Candidatus Bathyarchaeota archaeon]|nr:hypothetical protein [Candidatus Bathyarchaeota archaeon]RJS74602.1 MAG: hypothetical protein CW710_01255 [Candidatus Bathyarchaeota archaeon]
MAQRLTDELIEQIVEEYKRGVSIRTLYKKTGLPIYLIYYALGRAGIKPRAIRKMSTRNVTRVRPLGGGMSCRTVIPSSIIKQLDLDLSGELMAEWEVLDKEKKLLKVRLFKLGQK